MSKNTEYITETNRSLQVIARLEREILVAVATEGVNIGKEGPLTLLQIGTCSGAVYIFDVLQNRDLISKGRLRVILESDKIIKVEINHNNLTLNLPLPPPHPLSFWSTLPSLNFENVHSL